MMLEKDYPINGIINALSMPIKNVEPGMYFSFDGKTLSILPGELLDDMQLMDFMFQDFKVESTQVNAVIEGSVRPSGEYIAFHVACSPGMKNRGIRLGVVAFWILDSDFKLEDIGRLRLSGLCVDSFCPMDNVKRTYKEKHLAITAVSSPDNIVDLGEAHVCNKRLKLSAGAFWNINFPRQIEFESHLFCDVEAPDYALMREIYINVASTLRFCLGRGNVDFGIELCRDVSGRWEAVGTFTALHGKMYIPDEYDEPECKFMRAKDIGEYFGQLVSAFADGQFERKALSQSREDAGVITYAKVIELTASFEREFRETFKEGVEHGAKTHEAQERAKEAMLKAAEQLTGKSKEMVRRLSKRVYEDNLETRIRYTCKKLPEKVNIPVFRGTGVNQKNVQLGKKIAEMRNALAHGDEPQYELSDIRDEYRLFINLVFIMRLMRLGLPEEDLVRLMKRMG